MPLTVTDEAKKLFHSFDTIFILEHIIYSVFIKGYNYQVMNIPNKPIYSKSIQIAEFGKKSLGLF